jgi:hypothetical protein
MDEYIREVSPSAYAAEYAAQYHPLNRKRMTLMQYCFQMSRKH